MRTEVYSGEYECARAAKFALNQQQAHFIVNVMQDAHRGFSLHCDRVRTLMIVVDCC